jgi:hypothetical protein
MIKIYNKKYCIIVMEYIVCLNYFDLKSLSWEVGGSNQVLAIEI